MKFEEYFPPVGGNPLEEAARLLGDQAGEYSRLQNVLDSYPAISTRDEHIQAIREFYSIALRAGIRDLVYRADPFVPWLAEQINESIEGKKIVDVGCCSGFFSVFYAINHPECQFTGIDLSEDALKSAQEKAKTYGVTNIRWVPGDVLEEGVGGELEGADTIILQDVLFWLFGNAGGREAKILRFLSPYQRSGSIAVMAEGSGGIMLAGGEGYVLHDHKEKTLFDQGTSSQVRYRVSVFRKLDRS